MTVRALLPPPLALESAGPCCWRVCDRRVSQGHGRFVGFVEQKGDVFEVMQQTDDFVWTDFPSLDSALEYIVAASRRAERFPSTTSPQELE